MARRNSIETELGEEIQCSQCHEFWPADPEFFFYSKGKPHSWCKACYVNHPKMIAKRLRWNAITAAKVAARKGPTTCTSSPSSTSSTVVPVPCLP